MLWSLATTDNRAPAAQDAGNEWSLEHLDEEVAEVDQLAERQAPQQPPCKGSEQQRVNAPMQTCASVAQCCPIREAAGMVRCRQRLPSLSVEYYSSERLLAYVCLLEGCCNELS
jgi:hypothetical protein